jgi:hypothetical protein
MGQHEILVSSAAVARREYAGRGGARQEQIAGAGVGSLRIRQVDNPYEKLSNLVLGQRLCPLYNDVGWHVSGQAINQ